MKIKLIKNTEPVLIEFSGRGFGKFCPIAFPPVPGDEEEFDWKWPLPNFVAAELLGNGRFVAPLVEEEYWMVGDAFC